MTANLTITATTGPGKTVTAQTFTGLTNLQFDFGAGVLFATDGSGAVLQFAINAVTTMTVSVSGGVYTITMS